MSSLLDIQNLRVNFKTDHGPVEAVRGISFSVAPGETLAVVGESGSGKSQVAFATMGLVASNGSASGSVRFKGQEILGLPPRTLNDFRGRHLSMIFQEPMTSLNPLQRVGRQIADTIRYHQRMSSAEAMRKALSLLEQVKIPRASERLKAYPHEMSGGQRQRVLIAMAIANDPAVLLADEPTTALDVTVQAEILKLLAELQRARGMGMVFISHDLNVVRRISNRVAIMKKGEILETGPTENVFANPQHAYTRALLAAEPTGTKTPVSPSAPSLLTAIDVDVTFEMPRPFLAPRPEPIRAVQQVSLDLKRGETVGIVGESGSGKSTFARAVLGLLPAKGKIRFAGQPIEGRSKADLRPLRKDMQIVLQDPFGSLSPRLTAGEIVTEGLLVHDPAFTREKRDARAAEALVEVNLDPAMRKRYPHEFSGGQRQRLAIARAMILKPRLVVLDEPTSALDREVQKQIVELLRKLQADHDLSYLFISHDLAVVRAMADRIIVMKDGKVVEEGTREQIFTAPVEDYTKKLIAAAVVR
jgi:ABC-type microcin C transport system duplicated ATPase subunit YejF